MKQLHSLGRWARRQFNRAQWRIKKDKLPRTPKGELILHVGCGDVAAPGYVNIDARPLPHVHFVIHDLRDLEFIPANSVDMVYMCHVLEHVRHLEVGSVVRIAGSILRPGGLLRIAVPDFDLILKVYEATGHDMDAIVGVIMGGQDYPENTHFNAFNDASLAKLLLRSGFKDVRPWDADRVDHHEFVDTSNRPYTYLEKSYPVSLNLEAVKT